MTEKKRVIRESIEVGPNVIVTRSGGRSVNVNNLLSSKDVIDTLREFASRRKKERSDDPQMDQATR